uniref:Uncharacterized protein n=1 Tax=Lotus japonicus TaxID=34305 RepID=I3T215_LOTJA|nr:unknown [Lotus japonicus]
MNSGSSGSELYGSAATTLISGSKSTRDLTVVDFPVPLSPMIITPPILGSITLRRRQSFISSCPTIAANGYTGLWLSLETLFRTCSTELTSVATLATEN